MTPRTGAELPSALEREGEIVASLAGHAPIVFLDYDGTLTPIVDDPAQALLTDETREVVRRLARRMPVAVLSGRDLADVRALVALPELVYAGSHGFDIAGPGGLRVQHAEASLPALNAATADLGPALAAVPGALLERKRFAVAVHYRRVSVALVPRLTHLLDDVAARHPGLRRTGGKKVFELRPDVAWDKGTALVALLEALAEGLLTPAPIFIGDDVTDEDGFRAIPAPGIPIVVGPGGRPTLASYRLGDPGEVRAFLERLAQAC